MDQKEIIDQDFIRLREMVEYELRRVDDNDRREHLHFLESELGRGKVVTSRPLPEGVVTMESQVRLIELDSGEEMTYQLVFPEDADLQQGLLDVLAPLGTAILGRRVNETVTWEAPDGQRQVKIIAVSHPPKPNKS